MLSVDPRARAEPGALGGPSEAHQAPFPAAAATGRATGFAPSAPEQEKPMHSDRPWIEETIVRLQQLWHEGFSTAEIGRSLNVSKNAVIGKAHRLNLPRRPSPIKRGEGMQPPRIRLARLPGGPGAPPTLPTLPCLRRSPAASATADAAPPAKTPPLPSPNARTGVGVMPMQSGKTDLCCWPIGEPGTSGFHFCDAPALTSKPYCGEHAHRAYAKVRVEKAGRASFEITYGSW